MPRKRKNYQDPYEPYLHFGVPSFKEYCAITHYYDNGDTSEIETILQSDTPLSKPFLRFVSEMIGGRIKRRQGQKPSTQDRDIEIFVRIDDFLNSGFPLTGTKGKSAIGIVAGNLNLSEDAIKDAYYRGKKINQQVIDGITKKA